MKVTQENWPIAGGFRISRGSKTHAEVLVVSISDDHFTGRGECVPYARYGETLNSVHRQIQSFADPLEQGASRIELQSSLPAGAARNALDCALWDLQSQQSGKPVWQLAGLPKPLAVTTAFTLSLAGPKQMVAAAKVARDRPVLKLKLAGDETDKKRVLAIAHARPDARLILDGNEGFCIDSLQDLLAHIADLNIAAIEQPLPTNQDAALAHINSPFPICADESLHTLDDLPKVAKRYDMVNIKLDKTGGLSQALLLLKQAKALNLQIMLGCMVATSLSMLPILMLANQADLVDLDGPLLLENDRKNGLQYEGAHIGAQTSGLWGYPRRA